jgi:hypothetical protein
MLKRISKEERQMILDALLFTSSCDITADFDDEYLDKLVEIAKKLGGNPSQRLSIFMGGVLEDEERSKDIAKNFLIKHEK